MGKVLVSMIVSLDRFIEDRNGGIEFSAPDEDVHRMANEQARRASACFFGRRLYEVMEEPWTAAATRGDLPDVEAEFARYLRPDAEDHALRHAPDRPQRGSAGSQQGRDSGGDAPEATQRR